MKSNAYLESIISDMKSNNNHPYINNSLIYCMVWNYINNENSLFADKYLVFSDSPNTQFRHTDFAEFIDFMKKIHMQDFLFAENSTSTLYLLSSILSNSNFEVRNPIFYKNAWGDTSSGIVIHIKNIRK